MNKNIVLFFSFFFSTLFLSNAQQEVFFKDDFNYNKNEWELKNNKLVKQEFKNGNLLITQKERTDKHYYYWRPLYLSEFDTFRIESRLKLSEGSKSAGFGLSWSSKDPDNSYLFQITANGQVTIHAYTESKYFPILPWKNCPFVNTGNKFNTLAIEGTGRKIYFFVNGNEVYSSGFRRFFDYNTGWVLNDAMTIAVDYLNIYQKKEKIDSLEIRKNPRPEYDLYWKAVNSSANDSVILISGKVINEKTKKGMKAELIAENQEHKKIAQCFSNSLTGDYQLLIPYYQRFKIKANAEDFLPHIESFQPKTGKTYIEIQQDISLNPLEIGNTIQLKNVLFEKGKANLLKNSFSQLDILAEYMLANPGVEIELAGHTDNQGNPDLNLKLSEDRVKAVKKYLIKRGVDKKRISGKGYGGSKPLVGNKTELMRKHNRRVEFKIIKK